MMIMSRIISALPEATLYETPYKTNGDGNKYSSYSASRRADKTAPEKQKEKESNVLDRTLRNLSKGKK